MKRSLSSHILAGFALVATVPVLAIAMFLYTGEQRQVLIEGGTQLRANANVVAGYLHSHAALQNTGGTPGVRDSIREASLADVAARLRRGRFMVVTDSKGGVIWASPSTGLKPGQVVPLSEDGLGRWLRARQEPAVGAFAAVGNGWHVMILQSHATLMAGARYRRNSMLVGAGVALLAGLLLAMALAARITGPLEQVGAWLRDDAAASHMPKPAPAGTPREIADLVMHIEESTHRLRTSHRQLEQAVAERDTLNGQLLDLLAGLDKRVAERTADLQVALRGAEHANATKSRFLANMSHELRTPLNSVIGFSAVLLKNRNHRLGESELGMLQRIRSNGHHLLTLINDLLDVSKIEAGRMTLELRSIDVAKLARHTVEELEGQVAGRPVELRVEGDTEWMMATDEARLRQVLINLVGNSVKFTREGLVTVRIDAAGGAISVQDTGIGIPAHRLESIFRPFEQGDSSTTRHYGGTGLGLSICRSLCEMLGASLSVESTPGEGSTFTIRFAGAPAATREELVAVEF